MDRIEQNRLYKLKKKEDKIKKKTAEKIKKRQLYLEWLKKIQVEKYESSINIRYEKKLSVFKKRQQIELEKKLKNIEREKKGKKIREYKKKKPSWSNEFEKLLTLTQKCRRMTEAYNQINKYKLWYCKCFTCENIRHWKDMHWWHWISRAKKNTAWMPVNIHLQCPSCNVFHYWRPIKYKENFIKRYWQQDRDKLKRLSEQSIDKNKYDLQWIKDRQEKVKNEIKILEKLL